MCVDDADAKLWAGSHAGRAIEGTRQRERDRGNVIE